MQDVPWPWTAVGKACRWPAAHRSHVWRGGLQRPRAEARAMRERLKADGGVFRRAPTQLGSHSGALGPTALNF